MLPAIQLESWLEWLIRSAAALAAAAVIYRKGIQPAFHFLKRIGDGVEYVQSQLIHNGGSTLKDAVDATRGQVAEIVDRLDTIDKRVEFLEEVHRKQDEVDRIVADNAAKLAALRPTLHLPPTNKESA